MEKVSCLERCPQFRSVHSLGVVIIRDFAFAVNPCSVVEAVLEMDKKDEDEDVRCLAGFGSVTFRVIRSRGSQRERYQRERYLLMKMKRLLNPLQGKTIASRSK